MIAVHYLDFFIKTKTSKKGVLGKEIINFKDYNWRKNFMCPFTNKKGAFIKKIKIKKIKVIDAYFLF